MVSTGLILALLLASQKQAPPARAQPVVANLESGLAVLDGPWRFHAGDDPRWADRTTDDATWESVSLSAPESANDGDAGFTRYAPGWTLKGHPNLTGYAWYRLRVCVPNAAGYRVSIAAPFVVDDAYELFVDGRKLGGIGLDGTIPQVLSPQPAQYPISGAAADCRAHGPLVVAIRTWMAPAYLAPGSGGIHIAPALGTEQGIDAWIGRERKEIFWGYVVDALEPILCVVLAFLAVLAWRYERTPAHLWLATALIVTAIERGNNAFFAWYHFENASMYVLVSLIICPPLVLAFWTIASYRWVRPAGRFPMETVVAALVAGLWIALARGNEAAEHVIRYAFALLLAIDIFLAFATKRVRGYAIAVSMVLLGVALFASELSRLHVPSIWFVLGTGVSRTQYALAALIAVLFYALLTSLRARAGGSQAAKRL